MLPLRSLLVSLLLTANLSVAAAPAPSWDKLEDEAQMHCTEQNFPAALALFKQALSCARKAPQNDYQVVVSLTQRARAYVHTERYAAAEKDLLEATSLARKNPNMGTTAAINAFSDLGDFYCKHGDPQKALAPRQEALNCARRKGGRSISLQLQMGEVVVDSLMFEKRWTEAIATAKQLLELSKFNMRYIWVPHLLCHLAQAYNSNQQYKECQALLEAPLARMEREGETETVYPLMLAELGKSMNNQGNDKQALALFAKAEALVKPLSGGNEESIHCYILDMQGDCYAVRKDWKKCEQYYLAALHVADGLEDPEQAKHLRQSLHDLYITLGRKAEAVRILQPPKRSGQRANKRSH